jgi:hypothetical protein
MWILHMLLDTWLFGSLLLAFILLICWGGFKWQALGWLTRTRKRWRWLWIWGCYGFLKAVTIAAIIGAKYFPEFYNAFGFLGWEGTAVWRGFSALHFHSESFLTEFLLGFSLKAIFDAAIDSGLAAVAWWVHSLLVAEARAQRRITTTERYGVCLLFSACALGIANNFHFARMGTCSDCFRPDGIPFTLFHEGGFAGGEGFVWKGVIADSVIVLVVGIALGLIWNKLAVKDSNLRYS